MTNSCSFRITRTAEDLAQTVAAISQRLVKLEQRIDSLELNSTDSKDVQSDEEIVMLDGVDQLLQECKGLLNNSSNDVEADEIWLEESVSNQDVAA
jgi:DNA-binding transcriptional LysR family regulator|tara:strand:+ start:373 stop:660 length:288 start_codon:yes stop_codon:yes gene_type:complete